MHQANRSPMAEDVLKRIGRLYDVEEEAHGLCPPDRRLLIRQEKATPLIDELAAVLDAMLPKLQGKSDLAAAPPRPQPLAVNRRPNVDQDRRRNVDHTAG